MKKTLRFILFAFAMAFIGKAADAQSCSFTANAAIKDTVKICLKDKIQFVISHNQKDTDVTDYTFYYGDTHAQVNSGGSFKSNSYVYPFPGVYTPYVVVHYKTGDSCVTPALITIKVLPSPFALYKKDPLTKDTQCYEGNQFCLLDSSRTDSVYHFSIVRRYILWDDGSLDSSVSGSWGGTNKLCHVYADPNGRRFAPELRIVDTNGCISSYQDTTFTVRGKLAPQFLTNYTIKCDSTPVFFTNTSFIDLNDVQQFTWIYGDPSDSASLGHDTGFTSSSPPTALDKSKHWTKFTHWYYTTGPFAATLKITSKYGCRDSFTLSRAGDNVKLILDPWVEEDTMCAAGNMLYFHTQPLFAPYPGKQQVYWYWNHPPPMNIDSGSWDPSHSFPGCSAPKGGKIFVRVWTAVPPCQKIDSVINIKLYGPSAKIENPPVSMINDTQRHQCDPKDTVFFVNNSDTCTGLAYVYWWWDFDDGGNPLAVKGDTGHVDLGNNNNKVVAWDKSLNTIYLPSYDSLDKYLKQTGLDSNYNLTRAWTPWHWYDTSVTAARCHTPKFNMRGMWYRWDTIQQQMVEQWCTSNDQVPLALMPPKTPKYDSFKVVPNGPGFCYGPMPPYGVKFNWAKSKPGCTQAFVSICFDSLCCNYPSYNGPKDPNCWTPQSSFNIPPWSPFPPFPTQYPTVYPTPVELGLGLYSVCDTTDGWVTIGLAIMNGYPNSTVIKNKTTGKWCVDTQWYHRKLRFVPNNPRFNNNANGLVYRCKYDPVSFPMVDTIQDSIIEIIWSWGDLTYTQDKIWRRPVYKRMRYEYNPAGGIDDSIDLTSIIGDTIVPNIEHTYKAFGRYRTSITMMNTDSCVNTARRQAIIGEPLFANSDKVIACEKYDTVHFQADLHYFDPIGPPFFPDIDPYDYWVDPYHNSDGTNRDLSKKNLPTGVEWFRWDFGDNLNPSSSKYNPSHVFSKAGIYDVQLFVKDSTGCRDTVHIQVYVQGINAKFNTSTPNASCADILAFIDSSSTYGPIDTMGSLGGDYITEWYWDWGDNTNGSRLQNPVHSYSHSGLFKITLIVKSFQGCWDTAYKYVLAAGPKPNISLSNPTDTIGCAPFTVTVLNNTLNIDPKDSSTFQFDFGDGTNPVNKGKFDTSHVTHVYKKTGIYEIYITATEAIYDSITGTIHFCTRTYPDTISGQRRIIIVVLPTPLTSFHSKDSVCVNDPITFINTSDPVYTKLPWNFGDGTPIKFINRTVSGPLDSITHTYKKAGYDTVRIKGATYSPGTCPVDTFKVIKVTDVSTDVFVDINKPGYSANGPYFCFYDTNSNNIVKWEWDFDHPASGLNNFSNDPKPCHDYGNDRGDYWVRLKVTSSNGCTANDSVLVHNTFDRFVFIPNVFTPDDDNSDDEYYPTVIGIASTDSDRYMVRIFNRWGEKVFESLNDTTLRWNGKMFNTGSECPEGTYYFTFNWKWRGEDWPVDADQRVNNGKKVEQVVWKHLSGNEGFAKGSITLLRKPK